MMIGKLKGRIDWIGEDTVIIEVSGVGYEVMCAPRILQNLPSVGEALELWIEMLVREDMIRLLGFRSDLERRWFRLLTTVQGVGAKVALAILGILKPSDLASAIALADIAIITQAPGVGKKVAERIITELKDKAPAMSMAQNLPTTTQSAIQPAHNPALGEAISALVNLGYGTTQAHMAVSTIIKKEGEQTPTASLIRLALKELANG